MLIYGTGNFLICFYFYRCINQSLYVPYYFVLKNKTKQSVRSCFLCTMCNRDIFVTFCIGWWCIQLLNSTNLEINPEGFIELWILHNLQTSFSVALKFLFKWKFAADIITLFFLKYKVPSSVELTGLWGKLDFQRWIDSVETLEHPSNNIPFPSFF